MSDKKSIDLEEVVCDCTGTTYGKLLSLAEQGIIDLDTISRKTGAISGCGSCEWDIEAMLDDYISQQS